MKFTLDDLPELAPCAAGQELASRRVPGGVELTLEEWAAAGISRGMCIWTMQQRAKADPEVFARFKAWAIAMGVEVAEDADVEVVIRAMDRSSSARVIAYIGQGLGKDVARASVFDENWDKLLEAFAD